MDAHAPRLLDDGDFAGDHEPNEIRFFSATSDGRRTIEAAELFAGVRLVVIRHDGQSYRLTITRNNRLILQT